VAEKRMFSKQIIDSDAFLDMPLSTQALYFHLNMRADDDGFINNPKKIQRMILCSEDDLRLLIAKKFVIPFESGVCVIKHWLIHNYIRKDTYKETVYTDEKASLYTKENKSYTLEKQPVMELLQECNEPVDEPSRSIDKNSIDKIREEKNNIDIPYQEIIDILNKKLNTNYRATGKKTKDLIKARFNEGYNLYDFELVITKKCAEWLNTDFEKFLRPETLFSNKFESYLNQKGVKDARGNNKTDNAESQKYNFSCFE
jgi:uncharacterized phage protein (TIGR02220 family)